MLQTRSSGVDFTIFVVEEHGNKEGNDVPLVRDLASDRRHTFRDLFYKVTEIMTSVTFYAMREICR